MNSSGQWSGVRGLGNAQEFVVEKSFVGRVLRACISLQNWTIRGILSDKAEGGDNMHNEMDSKTKYLVRELWILAWDASVQRASLYKEGAWKNERNRINRFKKKIIEYMKKNVMPQYRGTVGEQKHCENIRDLINYANTIDPCLFRENGYKYGVAQKLFNLALKYYWCLGQIIEPPHCPIDRIIIDKTTYKDKVNFTQMLTENEYLEVISAIRSLAEKDKCSIAQWELDNYERREPKPRKRRLC